MNERPWPTGGLSRQKQTNIVVDGKIGTGCRGRKRKQLLDDIKETGRYLKLTADALDGSLWRTRFDKGCGTVVRQCDVLWLLLLLLL